MLRAYVKKVGKQPTTGEKLHISQRRETLQAQIDAFHGKAGELLPDVADDEHIEDGDIVDEDWIPDADADSGANSDAELNPFLIPKQHAEGAEGHPEHVPVHLPSFFGATASDSKAFKSGVTKEIALRVGQAHDCLHAIRLGIGNKSFAFRGRLRTAKYKTQKTRAWDTIHTLDDCLQHHRRVYNAAIQALKALQADAGVMGQFKEIKQADLLASTIVMNANARGQRNKALAWFWSSTGMEAIADDARLTECTYSFHC